MQYRKLGRSEIEVSAICMGGWQISSRAGEFWGKQDVADSNEAIHACLDVGINFFDTAEFYGEGLSEEIFAKALDGRRTDVVIATKVWPNHLRRDDLMQACERSLRRLNTDYIDLYQVHFPNPQVPLDETMAALIDLRDQGKVREIGVSNFGTSYLRDLPTGAPVVTNQLPYNLLWRAIEFEVLPACRQRGIGVLAYSPLMQSLLTGKFNSPDEVPESRQQTRIFSRDRAAAMHGETGVEHEAFEAISEIGDLCLTYAKPMADVAMAWLLAQEGVCSVIAGMRNARQVWQNAKAADLRLPEIMVRRLSDVTETLKCQLGPNADLWMHESRLERNLAQASQP